MSLTSLFTNPIVFLLWLGSILIALSVHEFSHALAASLLGDQTAKRMGRLTLNPFAHIDMFGLLALVFVHFGWGKPVPYNPNYVRYKHWGEVLIALAGPFSNLILLVVSGLFLKGLVMSLGWKNYLIIFLSFCFLINAALMLFNLIPLPPLDGSKLLFALLHNRRWLSIRIGIERYGPWVLMALVFTDIAFNFGIISTLLDKPLSWILSLFNLNNVFSL